MRNEVRNEKGQFLPGQSGNPKGKPKGMNLSDQLRKELEANPERVQQIIDAWIDNLVKLDSKQAALILRETLDRLEGRVPQALAHSGVVEITVTRDGG